MKTDDIIHFFIDLFIHIFFYLLIFLFIYLFIKTLSVKCESLGAQLVKIELAEENDFLKSTYLNSPGVTFWIGLSDLMQEGEWICVDGSSLGDYANWHHDPNNLGGNQHCVHIATGSFLIGQYDFESYDAGCNDLESYVTLGYICEHFLPKVVLFNIILC